MNLRSGAETGTEARSKARTAKSTKKNAKYGSKGRRHPAAKSRKPKGGKSLSPEDIDAIAQKNASSPLLRLPLEIKSQIYDLVIEGHFIHIYSSAYSDGKVSGLAFRNLICYKDLPGQREARRAEPPFDSYEHSSCFDSKSYPDDLPFAWEKPPLLLVCRQTYAEAGLISFSKHTLDFGWAGTFQGWMRALSPAQAASLRSVHLKIHNRVRSGGHVYENSMPEWEAAIKSMLYRVKGAAKIELDLHGMGPIADGDDIPEDLLRIGRLPLRSATMIMRQNSRQVAFFPATQEIGSAASETTGSSS